jgi:hypothetical protein
MHPIARKELTGADVAQKEGDEVELFLFHFSSKILKICL